MLKDDRTMAILTIMVVLIGAGMMIQRSEFGGRLFGIGPVELKFRGDEVIVRANTLSGIDVLANDVGIRDGDAANLFIDEQPKCGRVFVRNGQVYYLPTKRCAGSQAFKYGISGRDIDQAGEVTVLVRLGEPTQGTVSAEAQRDITTPTQRAGAQPVSETAALLAAQPSATADTGGAIAPAPTVSRPEAPAITGLPDAASGAGGAAASGDGASTTIALARIDAATSGIDEATVSGIQRENDGLDENVLRVGPSEIEPGTSGTPGLGDPADALAAVRALGATIDLEPVDTTPPAVLSDPAANTAARVPQPAAPAAPVAARPSAAAPCAEPPELILDVMPAGLTEVAIDAPCHAGTVAELSYDGLRIAVALDGAGAGTVTAVGFQRTTDAVLRFAGGEIIGINLPFVDTGRIERVALIWEMPVELELHAFEFGARPRSDGHVRPDRPRSFGDVRRRGGGYLLEYQPVGSVGQRFSVYTYWRRHGSRSGVVKLKLDFASRDGAGGKDTCSGGAHAEPEFTVLRSVAGKLERPRRRRLAPLDCAVVVGIAGTADRFIGDAIDDMIVLQR